MEEDDLVGTINSDTEPVDEEDDSSEEEFLTTGKKKEVLNEGDFFGLLADESGDSKPWDFSYARSKTSKQNYSSQSTVDDKIKKLIDRKPLQPAQDTEEADDEEDTMEAFMSKVIQNDTPDAAAIERSKEEQAKAEAYFKQPKRTGNSVDSFMELNLSRPLIKAVGDLNYLRPTPIQSQAIPVALSGADVCGSASTGSGKTAAFVLPTLERLLFRDKRLQASRVLILLPTRELAVQCHSNLVKLAKYTNITAALVVGGLSSNVQASDLRRFPDIIVATPGRMIDHVRNTRSVSLEDIEILILDEADRLLDMGFTEEVEELVRHCPNNRQTLLFSATMTEQVDRLAKMSLRDPVRISVDKKLGVASGITQEFVRIRKQREMQREAMLLVLCSKIYTKKVLVFFRSKKSAHRMKIIFSFAGLNAGELHGNLTQNQRLEALENFRDGKHDFLLCTDLAARGLDILGIQTIVNYELPKQIQQYIHRVGRTARWGHIGTSVSFVLEKDRKLLKQIMKAKGRYESMKSRVLNFEEVRDAQRKIDDMAGDIEMIKDQEREERMLRKAEMEMNKTHNMIQYEPEIYARPAKTWFQSNARRKEIKERSAAALFGDSDEEKEEEIDPELERKMKKKMIKRRLGPYAGMSRKKRRRVMFREQLEKERKQGIEVPKEMLNEKLIMHSVRAKKAKNREKPSKHVDLVPVGKKGKGKKKGAFDRDMQAPKLNLNRARYSSPKRSHIKSNLQQKNLVGVGNITKKRKGKGNQKFKSKKKHKRR